MQAKSLGDLTKKFALHGLDSHAWLRRYRIPFSATTNLALILRKHRNSVAVNEKGGPIILPLGGRDDFVVALFACQRPAKIEQTSSQEMSIVCNRHK
jgi:hypothetical protein